VRVCTIGHSNLELDALIEALKENGVSWVADVRSVPYSRRYPQFNRSASGGFAAALEAAGIRYLFFGDRLGGKPPEGSGPDTWSQGKLNSMLVSGLSGTARWAEGMAALAETITALDRDGSVGCILCSEGDASNCHRSLISFELEQTVPDLVVQHIRSGKSARNEAHFQKALFPGSAPNDRALDH
jgi:uncharacterized protein (DUF488 family)